MPSGISIPHRSRLSWSGAIVKVCLFDIDGVLIEPLGYRQAVLEANRYFSRQLGLLDGLEFDPDTIAFFESRGITSEWDMVPISLAILLDNLAGWYPEVQTALQPSFEGTYRRLSSLLIRHPEALQRASRIDFRSPIDLLGEQLLPGLYPSESALQVSRNTSGKARAAQLFPRLADQAVLDDLLGHTRDLQRSLTTCIFQNLTLGSRLFQHTYHLPAVLDTPSLLVEYDRPQISVAARQQLSRLIADKKIFAAAYSMRPSLPPRGAQVPGGGYAPEAELALELAGLSGLPLIGYGRIQYLAKSIGANVETYLKPSPVQALAAIFAALSGDERSALFQAVSFFHQPSPALIAGMSASPLVIHVFEDSAGGIEAVRSAAELLASAGISTSIRAWGIASQPDKAAALHQAGVRFFPDVNQALSEALVEISPPENP